MKIIITTVMMMTLIDNDICYFEQTRGDRHIRKLKRTTFK